MDLPSHPGCSCFRLCSESDARSFHLRLPKIKTVASPWTRYLNWVYGGSVSLPVDLRRFELFYLVLLPVEWRCSNTSHVRLPLCSTSVCAAWLLPEEFVTSERLTIHEQQWDLRSFQWQRSRLKALRFNHTLRLLPRWRAPTTYRSGGHVEVSRRSAFFFMPDRRGNVGWDGRCAKGRGVDASEYVGHPKLGAAEGVGYGCWFTPTVGSGSFLPLGNALVVHDRHAVEREFPEVMRFAGDSGTNHHDCLYANLTRSRGFDTLVVLNNTGGATQIISASDQCMDQHAPLPNACVPISVGLRAGWHAERPCRCSETEPDGLAHILNCALAAPDHVVPLPSSSSAVFSPNTCDTDVLSACTCDALLEEDSLLQRMWSIDGWKQIHDRERPCWGEGSGDLFFNSLTAGGKCSRNFASSLRWRPTSRGIAPAVLGFDFHIKQYCEGLNLRQGEAHITPPNALGTGGAAAECVQANRTLLSLAVREYNSCRNLEWLVCAAMGRLNGQLTSELVFATAPGQVPIRRTRGFPGLGTCSGYAPHGCGLAGYANDDIFYLETCILSKICSNADALFRLGVGELFSCELKAQGVHDLQRLLVRTGT